MDSPTLSPPVIECAFGAPTRLRLGTYFLAYLGVLITVRLLAPCIFWWNFAPNCYATRVTVLQNTMSTHDAPALYENTVQAVDSGNIDSLERTILAQGESPERDDDRLAQAVESKNLVILSSVINTLSKTHKREDVLADALVIGCEKGRYEAVHHLLADERADPNVPSATSKQSKAIPALIVAVNQLQTAKSDTIALNHARGPRPQFSAAQQMDQTGSNDASGRTKIIESLLYYGALLTACDPDKRNVLFHIISGEIADTLLTARAGSELQQALASRDESGNDALMSAILRDCDSSVSLALITHGANIRTVDNDDRTTLMSAGWKGRIDVVERLLQDESLVKTKDKRGRTIWHHVASYNTHVRDEDVVRLLSIISENDASVNATDVQDRTPLHFCSIFGTLNVAKALLESNRATVGIAEPNENKTALHFAAAYGDHAMVKLLIGNGAERVALCNSNLMPLHLACGSEAGNVDAVEILLAKKADAQLKARTEDNMTPLHIAAAHGHVGIVEALLRTPGFANVDAHCQGGWTALHLACGRQLADHSPTDSTRVEAQESRYPAVVKALLKAGSQVNQKSQTCRTALHIAAEFGHVEIVKLLLKQRDVQFAAKDSHGNTPLLDAARSEHRNEILPLLAPWTNHSIEALPENVKQSAQDFDANVIDFEKISGARPRRHKIPVFDLLYKSSSEPGAISRKGVSTIPDPANEGGFRWIHLPANNLHWCHTLLTKHFIEGGFEDVDGFKDLERTLSQQQYRGRKTHSQFMRPTCSVPSHQPGAQSRFNQNASGGAFHPERANSLEVLDSDSAPPDPKNFTSPTDKDLSGLTHPELDRRNDRGTTAHRPPQLWSPPANGTPADQTVPVSPSKIKTEPRKEPDNPANEAFRAFLFLPYLALESERNVKAMHDRSERTVTPGDRDIRLHQAYSDWEANDYGLHIRRTLDQFFYRNVDTRQRDDDQVVLRYQRKENPGAAAQSNPCGLVSVPNESAQDFDIIMVDQLWVWVLGPGLVVTSFPQKWEQSRRELPDLLSSVLEKLDPRTGDPVQSIYGLAACIVGQCMSACDRAMYQSHKASVFDMFSGSVGNAMNEEVKLFSRFEKASIIASRWVKRTLRHNTIKDSIERQNLETSYDRALQSVSSQHASPENGENTDEPSFVEDLLDIQHETHLLEEVKDIRDELGILLQVTEEQHFVHGEILTTFHPALKPGSNSSDRQKIEIILGEQNFSLHQQKIEIKNMMKQVGSVYKSIRDLLDHKQKHANAIEARYARKQASDTAKAGRTLMVFTTVTVIFLPLSFLAAFFAINIKELPHAGDNQQMSLAFIMRNVVGVGLGTALVFVLLAWHYHRVVPWGLIEKARLFFWNSYESSQTWFSKGAREGQPEGTETLVLAKGFVADGLLERGVRQNRVQHDEERQ